MPRTSAVGGASSRVRPCSATYAYTFGGAVYAWTCLAEVRPGERQLDLARVTFRLRHGHARELRADVVEDDGRDRLDRGAAVRRRELDVHLLARPVPERE